MKNSSVELNELTYLKHSPPENESEVAILLCTLQGQKYLAEQLESFQRQTHENWKVWASDDGSKDNTAAILGEYQKKWPKGKLSVRQGPGNGFFSNFLFLTCRKDIQADYFAYSDQDDIWEEDKLQRAINCLKTIPHSTPALYCTRTRLVDVKNQHIVLSHLFTLRTSFSHALVQSISGGNTMVFNRAARALLLKAGDHVNAVSHDWWAYMVVSGCGGKIFYDPYPSVRYRQHPGNMVGSNMSWRARMSRARMLRKGIFKCWNDRNIKALEAIRSELTPENLRILEQFTSARKSAFIPRLIGLYRSGIYRQTALGNIGLITAAIFNKL